MGIDASGGDSWGTQGLWRSYLREVSESVSPDPNLVRAVNTCGRPYVCVVDSGGLTTRECGPGCFLLEYFIQGLPLPALRSEGEGRGTASVMAATGLVVLGELCLCVTNSNDLVVSEAFKALSRKR